MFIFINKDNGYTLLEILIALMIFTFGLLAIAGLQISSIGLNSAANQRTAITMLSQGIMEEIMAFPEDNSNSTVMDLDPTETYTQEWTEAPFDGTDNICTLRGGGSFTATVAVVPDTPVDNMSKITVTVTENGGRSVSMTSFKRLD